MEVTYGEYPQTVVAEAFSSQLENAFSRGLIRETGKKYTTDSVPVNEYDTPFVPKEHIEYTFEGKKYIRIVADKNINEILSNGQKIENKKAYWVEVEPVKWLVDEKKNIAISKNILFAGVQFNKERNYEGDFDATDICTFMEEHLSKDLALPLFYSSDEVNAEGVVRKSRIQKMNPDETIASSRRKMTDTERIHNWIESGQSVLLRGPSGIGKTERIKSLYPNLLYLKLTNNMLPEKVVGSSNFQTGQNIPPDFFKEALLSCSTEEERKLIQENIQNLYEFADQIYERSKNLSSKNVILLDELLNVKPVTQSLVYTLVLNRLVEIGKGLKLPENFVLVATGNQKRHSNVAEDLAGPLEKRFDHIFDMEPKVMEWITEYAIPNHVHSAVIGYIYSKYIEYGRSEDISNMGYFYEEPEVGEKHIDKNGCRGKTNDPRGWVSVSNMLYSFEKDLKEGKFTGFDVEDILRVSLHTKLRQGWAEEFFNFYNIPVLSVADVVSNNYTQADLPRNTNEMVACINSLLLANENEVAACRKFIKMYCSAELLRVYELNWAADNPDRITFIYRLQELEKLGIDSVLEEGVEKSR